MFGQYFENVFIIFFYFSRVSWKCRLDIWQQCSVILIPLLVTFCLLAFRGVYRQCFNHVVFSSKFFELKEKQYTNGSEKRSAGGQQG